MFRFSRSVIIDRPATDVWSVLIDFPNIPTWEGGVNEVRQISPGPPGVGTELTARRVYAGREALIACRITDWQEGRSATMSLAGGPLRQASVTYTVEPVDGRSKVTYSAEGDLIRSMAWLSPFVPQMGRQQTDANLAKLKRLVEGQRQS